MASGGKKGKKAKWIPANITDIIAEPTTIPTATQSWADAAEDEAEYTGYGSRRQTGPVVLPSASRAARGGLTVDDDSIPRRPPYSAYICNLPYDVDEIAIGELFEGLKIQNLRLPREGDRLKGYGYVDFEDRESLVDAMNIADPTISGRKIRIEVSTQDNERRMGGRGGRMGDRERDYDPERTAGDWRSGPRAVAEPEPPRGRGMDRERPRERDRDGSTGEPVRPGAWRDGDRPAPEPARAAYGGRDSFGRDRDRGGFEERDRFRDRPDRDRGFSRDGDRGYSRDGDRERGGYGRDGFRPAPERDAYRDGERGGSRGFGERRGFGDRDRERDPPREEAKPRERPKLNLLPRTVPLDSPPPAADEKADEGKAEEPRVTKPTAAQVFGGAKPVDTAAKEREIEERLKKQEEEAKQRADEGGRWGRRGDAADTRGPPRRTEDRGRDSRSYRDKRDYSRDKDSRDYLRDSKDNRNSRDFTRDNRDRDYVRDKEQRSTSQDKEKHDISRDKEQRDPSGDKEQRDSSRGKERRDSSRDMGQRAPSRDKERHDDSRGNVTEDMPKGNGERTARSKERANRDGVEEIVLPKLKEKEAPNFAATNKFSFLEDVDAGLSD